MSEVLGVIVAGGAGSRMGKDKALVELAGRSLLQHVASALDGAALPVVVSGRSEPIGGYDATPDVTDFDGAGPALGLLSVFRRYGNVDLFLTAVDQPLLRPATIQRLLQTSGDIAVPMVGQHPQVTCALYRSPCHQALEDMLSADIYKLRSLLSRVSTTRVLEDEWRSWGEDGRSWLSLDTPQAVRAAEDLL